MYLALILLYLISLNQLSKTRLLIFHRKTHLISSPLFRSNKAFYGPSIISITVLLALLFLAFQVAIKFSIWKSLSLENIIQNSYLSVLILPLLGLLFIKPTFNTRKLFEASIKYLLHFITLITCAIIILMLALLLSDTLRFFTFVPITNFIFGLNWNPQNTIDYTTNLGIIPLLTGTALITLVALIIAVPMGILSSIFISEYLDKRYAEIVKSTIEILAGIPTIVYGYIAALFVAPQIKLLGNHLGFNISSESALAAGILIGIMLIPYIMSLSYEFIKTIPSNLKDAAISMGATKEEMIMDVLIPTALPGIIGGTIMALSRAIGETMIVTMAAGLIAKISFNPTNSVTTMTAQIVSIISGDQEFDSPKTLSAFALAFVLFCITLFLNIGAHKIIKNFKNKIGYYA
jgi:phosphate transport system permease protein